MSGQVKRERRTARERKRQRQRAARLERKRGRRLQAHGIELPTPAELRELGGLTLEPAPGRR